MKDVMKIHNDDPNFPFSVIERIREFVCMEAYPSVLAPIR